MALARQYAGSVEKDLGTKAEYFEFERTAFGRWECVDGWIRQMAGGSDDHSTISMNIRRALGNVLSPRGCRVCCPERKIHTGDGVSTFPDVYALVEFGAETP